MKNAEKLYDEQVEELMPIFTKKLDEKNGDLDA